MKKILVMLVVALMTTMNVIAQDDTQHEIGVYYGFASASDVLSTISSSISAAAGDQSSFFGPIGVEYYYHVSPVVAVGGLASYATCKAEDKKTKKDDLTESFITVMPSVKFNWLRSNGFGMYSSLSAGLMFLSVSFDDSVKAADPDAKEETKAKFMFHATALGVEFGGNLRGFAELGFGEKGLLCAGLRYKF